MSGCSFIVSKAANIKDIKKVTGMYDVGTQRMVWVDSTRTNWYEPDYGPYRKLMAQIWYPANISNTDKKSNYIDNNKALTYTIGLQGYDVPEILTNQIGYINCNSWENPKPYFQKKFPILIFSHGHGGLRTQNTNQVEELVSHGYIIIAVDHTFDAGFVEFPDGEIIYSLTSRPNDDPLVETAEQFYARFGFRVDDINFIVKQIDKFSKIDFDIDQIMDKSNIGIFGHSFGFGIKDGKSAKEMARVSDGVIVGSALVNKIASLTSHEKISAEDIKKSTNIIKEIRGELDLDNEVVDEEYL